MGKASDTKGKAGEDIAHGLLEMMGARMLQKIATPVKFLPPKNKSAAAAFWRRIIFQKKVKGDRWGIEPETGKSILVEVKTYSADRLPRSALKPHQVAALNEHAACHGLTYLVWVHPTDIFVIPWPIVGFEHRTSLSLQDAARLKVGRIEP